MPQKNSVDKPLHWHPIHSAKEQKQNRLVIIGFIVTAALIVGLIGYAFLYEKVLKGNIPVAKVNGVAIDNEYFKDRIRLERNSYIQQFQILSAQAQFAAEDQTAQEYYQNQLGQIQLLLDGKEAFGKLVLDKTIDDELIAQQSKSMGIEVAETEIEEALNGIFNYFPKGTPTPEPTSAPYATPVITKAQEAILKNTPKTADIPNAPLDIPADLLNNQEPTATPLPTVEAQSPTATPYTEELYKQNYKEYIASMADITVTEKNLRIYMYHYLLDKKVMAEITKDVSREQEQVWARHILVKTQAEALIVLDRINKGEDWSVVAADISLDTSNKDNGGDLGWFARGRMVKAFEDEAYAVAPGKLSQPVETQFGWHIIQVVGHETFPLSDSDYQTAQESKYNDWFNKIKETADIKINDVGEFN
ncbi:MAG: peptidylprolyl isomerase [Pelolinea sp.]|nr:peptidylprolyl isomerase [Pelolinea sp.]